MIGAEGETLCASGGEPIRWTVPPLVVGVVMGSDSDLKTMRAAIDALAEFAVPCEVRVVSAHRTPEATLEYARTAVERGLRVIIAGAGGAAHLPGMLAAATPLPVIGVPVPLTQLDGLDSLLSIVQMPAGVPVAAVSIGGGRNAGLLAVRILATGVRRSGSAWRSSNARSPTSCGQRTRRCRRSSNANGARAAPISEMPHGHLAGVLVLFWRTIASAPEVRYHSGAWSGNVRPLDTAMPSPARPGGETRNRRSSA